MPEINGVGLSVAWPAYPMSVVEDARNKIHGSQQFRIHLRRIFTDVLRKITNVW